MNYDYEDWQPLSVAQVVDLLRGLRVPWWIAGGRAIDLFVGHATRAHADTDVLVCRRDQLVVQSYLSEWDLHREANPGLTAWNRGEYLDGRIHDVWCRRTSASSWSLQLMLLDTEGDEWLFKRDPTIRGPLQRIGRETPTGIPYLAPEVQLLYKAKAEMRPKDQADFEVSLPSLNPDSRRWLSATLEKRFPDGHPWLAHLRQTTQAAPDQHNRNEGFG